MEVRATQLCFIGNQLRQVGDKFDYDGPPLPKGTTGPIVPANEVIEAPPAPKRRGKRGYAPAPEWTQEGHPSNPLAAAAED